VLTVGRFLDRAADLAYGSLTFRFEPIDYGEAKDALVSAGGAAAFANPRESSRVAGIFDGADGDDIVSLVDENIDPSSIRYGRFPPPS
jgi:hypothetical protein